MQATLIRQFSHLSTTNSFYGTTKTYRFDARNNAEKTHLLGHSWLACCVEVSWFPPAGNTRLAPWFSTPSLLVLYVPVVGGAPSGVDALCSVGPCCLLLWGSRRYASAFSSSSSSDHDLIARWHLVAGSSSGSLSGSSSGSSMIMAPPLWMALDLFFDCSDMAGRLPAALAPASSLSSRATQSTSLSSSSTRCWDVSWSPRPVSLGHSTPRGVR